jgi:two-component sensor histidine kinase
MFCILVFVSWPSQIAAQYAYVNTASIRQQINEAKADTTRTRLYAMLGWEYRFSNQTHALALADSIITLATPTKDYTRLAEAYRIKGFVKIVNQDIAGCLNMYNQGLVFAKKAKSAYYTASIINLTAGMYQDKGDYDRAIDLYHQALKIAEDGRESEMIASVSNNIAEAYSDAGRSISFTKPFYVKALNEVLPRENWQYAGMIHSNMAKEYMMANMPDSARMEIRLSAYYLNKVGIRGYVYATCATDIAEILTSLQEYNTAENYLQEAYRILDSIGTTDNLLIVLHAMGNLYLNNGKTVLAVQTGHHLLKLAQQYHSKQHQRNAYKILSQAAEKKGQTDSALVFYKLYKSWNDSLFNETREQLIANAESRMKLQKQAVENNELKASNASLRGNILLTSTVAIILLLLTLLIILAYRKIRQKNLALEEQKQVIEKQHTEKDILLREVHHRVKNNLQVVSSLLNLQAATVHDQSARDSLMIGQKRIKAISLIHQNLYRFDNLGNLSLSDYVQELFKDLRQLYQQGDISLSITTNPADLVFEVEKSVPLGLIFNEVMTNALKYAFEGRKTGTIRVEAALDQSGNILVLQIGDNGIGLQIPFTDTHESGLGFKIIRELTRQLKGSVHCEVNNGTQFTFLLPHTKPMA